MLTRSSHALQHHDIWTLLTYLLCPQLDFGPDVDPYLVLFSVLLVQALLTQRRLQSVPNIYAATKTYNLTTETIRFINKHSTMLLAAAQHGEVGDQT